LSITCKVKLVALEMRTFFLNNNLSQTDIWRVKFEEGYRESDFIGIEGILICKT